MCKEGANTGEYIKSEGELNWILWDSAQTININLSARLLVTRLNPYPE